MEFEMKNLDSENAKAKILKAALNQFQKKGFDGARVDEIAKEAGVNKALIYYYFESKDKILEAVFGETANRFISETGKQMTETSGAVIDKHIDEVINYGQRFRDIVKIAFTESLKEDQQQYYLFELANNILSGLLQGNKISGDSEINISAKIVLFFFVTIPELGYIMLGDKWAEYNKVSREEVANTFRDTYKKILPRIIKIINCEKNK